MLMIQNAMLRLYHVEENACRIEMIPAANVSFINQKLMTTKSTQKNPCQILCKKIFQENQGQTTAEAVV